MQMTETFAATVAAVAPVIVLVGVVEVDQRRKILHESLTAELEALRTELDSLPAQPARHQVDAARTRLAALLPQPRRWTDQPMRAYFMGLSWILLVFALVAAEGIALGWLAKAEGQPDTGQAVYCLTVLVVGMFWVATPPMMRLLRTPIAPLDQRTRELRRLQRLDQELSGRQEM